MVASEGLATVVRHHVTEDADVAGRELGARGEQEGPVFFEAEESAAMKFVGLKRLDAHFILVTNGFHVLKRGEFVFFFFKQRSYR